MFDRFRKTETYPMAERRIVEVEHAPLHQCLGPCADHLASVLGGRGFAQSFSELVHKRIESFAILFTAFVSESTFGIEQFGAGDARREFAIGSLFACDGSKYLNLRFEAGSVGRLWDLLHDRQNAAPNKVDLESEDRILRCSRRH